MGIVIIYSFTAILLFLFLYFSFRFYFAVIKLSRKDDVNGDSLKISLVVSIKNEAHNIPLLIQNLSGLNYPENLLEIILIDDNSSDNSFELMSKLTGNKSLFKIYKVDDKPYPGKKGALAFGIARAAFGNIMITDADCRPEKDWLLKASAMFSHGYDLIFGIAPFYLGNSFANKISCFENLRNSILSFGLSGFGVYYSAAARNFGFKKKSFEELKCYSNTIETLSGDDDLLIREAVKKNMKIGIMMSDGSKVYSKSKNSLKEYFAQRSRHTKTSFYYLPLVQFILGLWHTANLLLILSAAASVFNFIFIIPFLIKMISDLFIVMKLQKIFGYRYKIAEVFIFQIVYEIFLVINFLNAAFRKDTWQ